MSPHYNAVELQPTPPPTPLMPTLTVTSKGVLHLHASLREQLGLRHGQPINLLPPGFNDYHWYLDLRPTAPCRVAWYNDTRLRVRGIQLPPGLVVEPLTLHLRTLTPEIANWYPLLPNAFATVR